MNILIPDNWLRDYLKTKATPEQIKEYLSLCGPSVERIYKDGKGIVYDVEVTSNRPDAMSVVGVAREAAAILPRFGIAARLTDDPYTLDTKSFVRIHQKDGEKKIKIITNPKLNPRWTSIVLTNIRVGASPTWLQKRLEATGIRPINNVIDVTNFIMRAYGQPAHAFDFDEIKEKHGIPTMILRASKKGEKIVTLDGKAHTLPGGDIVIEDGAGRLIDLCGIMGGYNSSIKNSTTNVVLFMQTYNPANIRKTTMSLSHRTEAASLFEKGIDPQLVLPAVMKGVELITELTGGRVASKLYDIYREPYKPYNVSVTKQKLISYMGTALPDKEIKNILEPLGFTCMLDKTKITVSVPSFRQDMALDVDIIEEVARIYGYHNITPALPETAPPAVLRDPELDWEEEIKTRLRDWGYTETYTYSMISEKLMDIFGLDKQKSYKIANPLSEEWVYMRPHVFPSVLSATEQNLHVRDNLRLFELSMAYRYRADDLPIEAPSLIVVWTGHAFREAKGVAEAIFQLFGVPFPTHPEKLSSHTMSVYNDTCASLGEYGSLGEIHETLLSAMGIRVPVTRLYLDFAKLVESANPVRKYIPIPKYPPVIEDFSFVVPPDFQVGPLIEVLARVHKLVQSVVLLDAYENKRTLRVTYSDPSRTLTNPDIAPVHQKILEYAAEKFGVSPVI